MRESFTYGSVGRALGNQCLYPEERPGLYRAFFKVAVLEANQRFGALLGLTLPGLSVLR